MQKWREYMINALSRIFAMFQSYHNSNRFTKLNGLIFEQGRASACRCWCVHVHSGPVLC